MRLWSRRKSASNQAEDVKTTGDGLLLDGIEQPAGKIIRVHKVGPAEYEGRPCLGVGDGPLRTFPYDDQPLVEEFRNILIANWGGGDYALKVVDEHGRFVKHLRFTIPVDEHPPKVRPEERISPRLERARLPIEPDIGLMPTTQTLMQALVAGNNQNLEALKLMMQQSNQDRQERLAESKETFRMVLDSVARVAEANRESSNMMIEALRASKEETMQLMRTMLEESKGNSQGMMEAVVSALMTGLNIGGQIGAPPKSELGEVLSSLTDAFKTTIETKARASESTTQALIGQAKEVAHKAVSEALKKQQKATASQPASTGSVTTADTSKADATLKALIECVRQKPATTNLVPVLSLNLPADMLQNALSSGDTTKVFEWLEQQGTPALVNELRQLLSDEGNRRWLRQNLGAEIAQMSLTQ